jgi:hypothetical protein
MYTGCIRVMGVNCIRLFPYRDSHIQNFVDYFGGNGNGLMVLQIKIQ